MNVLLKSLIKSLIPPILLRSLKNDKQSGEVAWGRPKLSLDGFDLPGGRKFYIRDTVADRDVFRQIFLDQEYSLSHFARGVEFFHHYETLRQPLIIDGGANIGASAVWFALAFPKAIVLAIEPDSGNFDILKRNTSNFANIVPINAALASKSGSIYLSNPGKGAWAYRTQSQFSENSYEVKAINIEDTLAHAIDGDPFIFKIDIEGAERELFSCPSVCIRKFPVVSIELHDWMLPQQANSANFLRWHTENNRDLVFRGENVFSMSNTYMSG